VYIRQSAHHHFATPDTLRATAVNLPRYRATEPNDVWSKVSSAEFRLHCNCQWPFYLAEVNKPILDIDFLSHFNLLVDIRRRRFIHGNTSLKVLYRIASISILQVPRLRFNIAAIYCNILNEFPSLIRSSIALKNAQYGVSHVIVTQR